MNSYLVDLRLQMAERSIQNGQIAAAMKLYEQVLALDADHLPAIRSLATLYLQQGKHDLAVAKLTEGAVLEPDNPEWRILLGNAHRSIGNLEDARSNYLSVIENGSRLALAYFLLASITKFEECDEYVQCIESEYKSSTPLSPERIYLAFALGKVFDDLGEVDLAFEYFQEANDGALHSRPFNEKIERQRYAAVKNEFDKSFFRKHSSQGINDQRPIIITGFPRSGTTLVEQVLASHPKVHAAGELTVFPKLIVSMSYKLESPYPFGFGAADPEFFNSYASEYVAALEKVSEGKPFTTDKGVRNDILIGIISAILPSARIIVCKRDPLDMGLSIYQRHMQEQGSYSNCLRGIGVIYRLFEDMLRHWDQVLPQRVHYVQYENLVKDFESQVDALLGYCGLPDDPACLKFHRTKRAIQTASHNQVNRPVYSDSVGRWKRYEKHLQPLIEAVQGQ